jgi:hypothetical protein
MERIIFINGQQFKANAITVGELRKFQPVIDSLGKSNPFESILQLMPFIHASFVKAHSDLTLEQLENIITLENFNDVFNVVLEASGLRKATAGEAGDPAQPATAN